MRTPGAFVTHEIFDQSVLVQVGKDGVIRAFHNVCQHRGNRLVEARRGTSPAITCGYHAWTYELDGALRGAPRSSCVPGFDKAKFALKPVRVEVFASFVFVNLDADARPLAETAPTAEAIIRRFIPDLDRLVLIEEVDVPVPANWKVIQENSIEGYHFDYSGPHHKTLVDLIDFAGYDLQEYGDWWTYVGPPKQGATEAYGVPLVGATWQTDAFFNIGLWPNATIYAFPYADVVGTFIMNPTGPESVVVALRLLRGRGPHLARGQQGLHPLDERGFGAGGHPPQHLEPEGPALDGLRARRLHDRRRPRQSQRKARPALPQIVPRCRQQLRPPPSKTATT